MAKTVRTTVNFWNSDDVAHVELTPKKSIRIYGIRWMGSPEQRAFDLTFNLGDHAEYDSYNLVYTGPIVSIGAKTVTVVDEYIETRKRRLNLQTFVAKNWNYDAEAIAKRNHETSMYI